MKKGCNSDFSRGYLCALAQLIRMQGGVSTEAYELFKAIGGDANDADEPDFEILYAYSGELTRKTCGCEKYSIVERCHGEDVPNKPGFFPGKD